MCIHTHTVLGVAAVDGPLEGALIAAAREEALLEVDALVERLDARHDAQPATAPLAVQLSKARPARVSSRPARALLVWPGVRGLCGMPKRSCEKACVR